MNEKKQLENKINLKSCARVNRLKETFDVRMIDFLTKTVLVNDGIKEDGEIIFTLYNFNEIYLCTCGKESICERRL
ncbi:MAG TPA: hypothetical protein VMZ91_01920 [Candidatus Paceibacterota bacterium]|nr:hypothetical protein [Candidatus Paceibacterota bacterium]